MFTAMSKQSPMAAPKIRGSKVFIVNSILWQARYGAGDEQSVSLRDLREFLGHFTPCSDNGRLSRLGAAHPGYHIVFVPDQDLVVEVSMDVNGEAWDSRVMSVSTATTIAELGVDLERLLREKPLPNCPSVNHSSIRWSLTDHANEASDKASALTSQNIMDTEDTGARRFTPMAIVSRKRKSIGGELENSEKKRRRAPEIKGEEFIGDLHRLRPVEPASPPARYLCPISHEIMSDPVVVAGSGNTYERSMIERHFQCNATDPLSNVRLSNTDQRLVPNNTLRSEIDEDQLKQVSLRLTAGFTSQREGRQVEEGMAACLSLVASVFRRQSTTAEQMPSGR